MARVDIIKSLYKKQVPYNQFVFDNLQAYPLLNYIHPMVIVELNKIANSVKLQSNPVKKMNMYDEILKPYNFKRLTAGTNRVVYKHLEDQRIVLKVAKDAVGIRDNPCEWINQQYLKPFVTKCFEISPCGTVGLFERVQPLTSKAEFKSISHDIFALLNKMIGKYILEDIGTKYFLNYGLRDGFGPVLLDYPYMYELDGRKIICNQPDYRTGMPCGGEIDYDDGFNNLICTKCGKVYLATDLQKNTDRNNIIIEPSPREKGGLTKMQVSIVETTYDEKGFPVKEEVVSEMENIPETSSIVSREEYNREMNVEVISSTKNKRLGDYIRMKKKHVIPTPDFEVSITQQRENEDETKINTNKPQVEVHTQQRTSLNPGRVSTINIRQDVFAMKQTRTEPEKESPLKVNEEYIQKELMGRDPDPEPIDKKESSSDEQFISQQMREEQEYEDSVIDYY